MQDYKRNVFLEADLQCSNIIQSMEKKLRAACQVPDVKYDTVIQVRAHAVIKCPVYVFFHEHDCVTRKYQCNCCGLCCEFYSVCLDCIVLTFV